jgi:hypothetical protein
MFIIGIKQIQLMFVDISRNNPFKIFLGLQQKYKVF